MTIHVRPRRPPAARHPREQVPCADPYPGRTVIAHTDSGCQVVDRAADLACTFGARLLIVHDSRCGAGSAVPLAALDHARVRGVADVDCCAVPERSLESLLDLAAVYHADLLVVGQPVLRSWISRVEHKVVDIPATALARKAPCDVLLVRGAVWDC